MNKKKKKISHRPTTLIGLPFPSYGLHIYLLIYLQTHTFYWRDLFTQTSDQRDPQELWEWWSFPLPGFDSLPSLYTSSLPPPPLAPLRVVLVQLLSHV